MEVLKRWLPVAAWSALILAASSDFFSSSNTGSFLERVLGREVPELLHFTLRKLGHLIGYGILGALAFRATLVDFRRRPFAVALAVVLLVATIDEWHQATLTSRTGTAWDVLLDVVGGAAAIALVVQKWRPR